MSGRLRDRNSLEEAKAKEAYIMHKNMLIGKALQSKLTEEKEDRKKHLRKDLINVRKEENVNE